jgi:hypothetical protein
MKKTFIYAGVILIILQCVGCQKKEIKEDTQNLTDESSANYQMCEFPQKYSYESDKLQIDIDEIRPAQAAWCDATASEFPIDYEELGKFFMSSDENCHIEDGLILSNDMVGDTYKEFYMWGNDTATYQTVLGKDIQSCLRTDEYYEDYNLEKYKEEKTFSFDTVDEIKKNIAENLQAYNINLTDEFECDVYYLDHDILKQEELHIDMDGNKLLEQYKTDWSQEDDTYLLYYHHTYSGLRDFQTNVYASEAAKNVNAQITVMYNKDGITFFYMQNMYNYVSSDKARSLLDFDAVMQSVIDYYDNIVDGAARRIYDAELILDCDTPNKENRNLIPVWAFKVEESPQNDNKYVYELRVNALSGKVIVR